MVRNHRRAVRSSEVGVRVPPREKHARNSPRQPYPWTPGAIPTGGYHGLVEIGLAEIRALVERGWTRRDFRASRWDRSRTLYSILGAIYRVMEIREHWPLLVRDHMIRLLHQAIRVRTPDFNVARLHSTGIGIHHWNSQATKEQALELITTAITLEKESRKCANGED